MDKLEEIKEFIEEEKIDVAIFDDDLSPSQLRNLEKDLKIKIYDRDNKSHFIREEADLVPFGHEMAID